MRQVRLLVPIVAIAIAVMAPAHAAKPKPRPAPKATCNLVTDPSGDAGLAYTVAGSKVADPSLDIVGADVVSDGKILSAVIRLKGPMTESDSMAPSGRMWAVSMYNGTASVGLRAFSSPAGGTQFSYSNANSAILWAKNEIHLNVKLSDIPDKKIVKGSVLRTFHVSSSAIVGYPPSVSGNGYPPPGGEEDVADAPATAAYTVGLPVCIKVGG